MPTAGQRSLGEFESDRPAAEAQAVVEDETWERVIDPSRDSLPEPTGTVEVGLTQVDYTVSGSGDSEYPVIHVFGRRPDGSPEHIRVHGFRPYFYAPAESVDEERLLQYDRITDWEDTDDAGDPFRSIRGDRLVKIYGQTPRDVGQIRDEFEHYEADILFPNRFLIDKHIQSGLTVPERRQEDGTLLVHHSEVEPAEVTTTPRVCMLDIEVDDRRGFPEDGEEPIVCLTTHDSGEDQYIAWLYTAPDGTSKSPDELAEYEPLTEGADIDVRSFDTESAMLEAVISYIETIDPDVLSGWNFTDFDAPYLLDRIEVLADRSDHDLSVDRLSRVEEVWRSDWGGPSIKGRVVFDLLYAYQRTKFTELDSYRLDDVGERELGVGKERYPGDIGDLWEEDPERLLEYNLRDVELCVELNRSQDIIPFWNEVRSFVGCKLEDATTPGDAVDMYVLHNLHGEYALPSKGQQESEDYEGGAVFDPITGVRENVSVLDLKSLYPMCMVTINASPETKVDPTEYDGETYYAPNGTQFRKEPDGAIREMVDELLTEREEKKSQRDEFEPKTAEYEQYDRQQQAVKVIMNCFTPDTEVLTPQGIRGIRELDVGDSVYSLDPETMQMEIKPVTETHEYPNYRGEVVDIETSTIDFRVTPNHRMLVQNPNRTEGTEGDWGFIEAGALREEYTYEIPAEWEFDHDARLGDVIDLEELARRQNTTGVTAADGGTKLAVPDERPNGGRRLSTDSFLELLAWYIAKGTVSEVGNYRINIPRADDVERVESSIDAAVDCRSDNDGRGLQFTDEVFSGLVRELCGSTSSEKRIPELVFTASGERKERFLAVLIEAAGDRYDTGWQYSTTSEQLRDDILRLCTQLGLTARYSRDGDRWQINCTEDGENSFRMHEDGSRSRAENGVYCVTVADNNTLLAGRNGTFQNVGNSLYGVLGWDRFRLYDREMGAAVTATGREVIEFTEEVTNELDKEVIYGDTDSVMVSVGEDVTKEEAIERSFEMEERINEAYDDFALEELNAAEHRFQIEFEKLYRRFFQAGRKKRYAGHIVWKEGQDVDDIDITGFEYQRSDIAPITKEVQHKVIEMIVRGDEIESITDYVHEVIEAFLTGEVDPEEIAIPGGIGKRLDNYDTATAHVRGARYANLFLDTNFGRGSKPKRVYLKKVHPDFFERIEAERGLDPHEDPTYREFKRDPDVICFEYADQLPEEFEIDWEMMLEKTLKGPIERILEALGVSWDEVRSGQEQTGLGQFM